ncbi:hypothetical protein TSUD_117140 [Trifolium subterraneum]|nr:hypothetical protein TSUD_117140 [Trifolium subterraneum]
MHPRQRSPRGFYASEYRHRGGGGGDVGFGRGYNNRRGPASAGFVVPGAAAVVPGGGGDVFVEAGRLAAEYLVSQGLLPPSVLSLKLYNNQNGSFKKHVGVVGGGGVGVGVGVGVGEISVDGGRASVLARLGNNAVPIVDGGLSDGRRKLGFEEFGQKGGSRRRGSFKSNGFDWVETDKNEVFDGELLGLKQSSSGEGKDACGMDVEFVGSTNGLENIGGEVKEVVKNGTDSGEHDDGDKPSISNNSKNSSAQSSDQENNTSGMVFTDLLSLCKSVKVPTKTRSSLTHKNLNALPHVNNGQGNAHYIGNLQGPEVLAENESVKGSSSGDLPPEKTYDIVHLDSDSPEAEPSEPVHSDEDMKELDTAREAEEDQSVESQSGQDGGYMHDKGQESTAELPEFGDCNSMSEERGEKRVADEDDVREDTKRLREWQALPSPIPKTEAYFLHNIPIEVKESPERDEISHVDKVNIVSDQGNLMSSSQFTDEGDRSFFECSEEKPPLPSSFRTCDLNLIEASEVHDNHVDHPVLIYSPPIPETKEAVPVGIDLSKNLASVSGKFTTHTTSGKEIEVIDLESDSNLDEKAIDSIDRKTDTMFTGLEGFTSHAQNAADIHDVQDGYGLMISELLGTDFTNCSSVPDDINSVHDEIGLHNGTVLTDASFKLI